MSEYSEEALVAEATSVLGDDPPVLAAGVFGLAGLVTAATGGLVAGSMIGGLTDSIAGQVGGALLGDIAAKHAYAESKGATLQLVVAVTATHIHVLNRDPGERLAAALATFERETCEVTVRKFGLSRRVELRDTTGGEALSLTGTTARLSPLAKGDRLVLELLGT
jgi:hypothetical protein